MTDNTYETESHHTPESRDRDARMAGHEPKGETMTDDPKCEPGCISYYGGEKKHHRDCPYYPESLTKLNADRIEALLAERDALEDERETLKAEVEGAMAIITTERAEVLKLRGYARWIKEARTRLQLLRDDYAEVGEWGGCTALDEADEVLRALSPTPPAGQKTHPDCDTNLMDGPIEVGQEFVWEPGLPHARKHIIVTRVQLVENDETRVWSRDAEQPSEPERWNDESRFREACVRVTSIRALAEQEGE